MKHSNFLLLSIGFAILSSTACHRFAFYVDGDIEHLDLPTMNEAREYLNQVGGQSFANYSNSVNTTGWAFFHVVTNGALDDNSQAYSAGFLEGYLTRNHIYDAYLNAVGSVFNNWANLSDHAYTYINNQTNWLKAQCQAYGATDVYWSVTCTQIQQLQGLYDGYISGVQEDQTPEKILDFNHFYYLTNMGDLEDIVPAFNNTEAYALKGMNNENMDCTIFIKLLENDLAISHNTHNIYALMLRIYKTYELHYQNPAVIAKTVSFSSRPGDLESKDDFYIADSGLVVMETSFNTYNTSNYKFLHYDSVPVWIRAQTATKMAKNASHWTQIFENNRSGTHNSQWIIVDMNQYGAQKNLPKEQLSNIVWICEEYYYQLEKFDATQSQLVGRGFVAGYNVPISQSIIDISAYNSTYQNDTRAIIFDKYGNNVTTIDGAKNIIRLNNNSTGSLCAAIAPRCDAIKNGYPFGAIDGKATAYSLIGTNSTWIVSSPSFNDMIPPFNWLNFPNTQRHGMPDIYNFDWMLYNFNESPQSEDSYLMSI